MKKIKRADLVLLRVTGALLLFGTFSLLLFPAPRFSAEENRYLAPRPDFSWRALANGSYTAAWESYTAERMPYRGLLRDLHAMGELALGKREVGGVMLCRDGSLARRLTVNERAYRKNLAALTRLSERAAALGTPLTVAVAPRRVDMRSAVLPQGYDGWQDRAPYQTLAEELPTSIALTTLTEDVHWFRTDHHWTAEGAFAAYLSLGAALGYTPYQREDFCQITVSNAFFGTSDAAAGIPLICPDKIERWRYEGDEALHLTKDGQPADFEGIYDFSKLDTRDGYAVFLGGNDGICEIASGQVDDRPTLLVFKDSFANALLPFLSRHYRILAVDPRYATKDIDTLLASADRVLVLMGMQTLTEAAVLEKSGK